MAAQQQALRFRLIGPLGLGIAEVVPWSLVIGFATLVSALLAARMGQIVELAFPALALLIGATLYFRHPTLYLGFTWWLWFLTPEVRRLVDYQIGWNEISPVMIAPYLVSGMAALTLVRCLPQLLQPRLFPFALILMALNYAYVGRPRPTPGRRAATYGLLTWIVPVLFGFHVAAQLAAVSAIPGRHPARLPVGRARHGHLRHRAVLRPAPPGMLTGCGPAR